MTGIMYPLYSIIYYNCVPVSHRCSREAQPTYVGNEDRRQTECRVEVGAEETHCSEEALHGQVGEVCEEVEREEATGRPAEV